MQRIKNPIPNIQKLVVGGLLLVALLMVGTTRSSSQGRPKAEVITAVTTGTGTEAGQITVMVQIYEFSTDDDKQILVDAFSKAQNQGLLNANALPKMKAVRVTCLRSEDRKVEGRNHASVTVPNLPDRYH